MSLFGGSQSRTPSAAPDNPPSYQGSDGLRRPGWDRPGEIGRPAPDSNQAPSAPEIPQRPSYGGVIGDPEPAAQPQGPGNIGYMRSSHNESDSSGYGSNRGYGSSSGYGAGSGSSSGYPASYGSSSGYPASSGSSSGYPAGYGSSSSSSSYSSSPQIQRGSSSGPSYNWVIPAEGILREVIQSDIQRYLGPEAHCKPGTLPDGRNGYFISASKKLTSAMIEDLKSDSTNWRRERRHGDWYDQSMIHRSRQHWGPTESSSVAAASRLYTPGYGQQGQTAQQSIQSYSQGATSQYSTPVSSQRPVQGGVTGPAASSTGYLQQAYGTYTASHGLSGETPRVYRHTFSEDAEFHITPRSARPGYYIASDGREYPLSQQPSM